MSRSLDGKDINREPDMMSDEYRFIKISMDEYVKWFDEEYENGIILRDVGPTLDYFIEQFPEYEFYISPCSIYYWDYENSQTIYRSETQKWVFSLEKAVEEWPEPKLTWDDVRQLITKITGK